MKLQLTAVQQLKADAFLIPFVSDLALSAQVCGHKRELIEEAIDVGLFKGEKDELHVITKIGCNRQPKYIILIGLGERPSTKCIAENMAKAVLKAQALKAETLSVALDNIEALLNEVSLTRVLTAMGAAEYRFELYKSGDKTREFQTVELVLAKADWQDAVREAEILIQAGNVARDLVNEPANVLKPAQLAEAAVRQGQSCGFAVEVLERSEIEKLGMKAYLAVAQGSEAAPKLIVMRYRNGGAAETFGLVGKGLTYDTGGYSLKPSTSMDTMKTDMGGSAAVIGAMAAIASAKLPVNVVGVVAACENTVSGHAIFPGDIIGSMCGKFIEVKNTDAEGRLTLIDAVHYAVKCEGAARVLDIATLTGAQVVALGDMYAGVLGNDEALMQQLKAASERSGDAVWELPYNEEVAARNKSKIADLMNIGNVKGMGCSVGGAFVGEGVDGKPWVHVDIAGVAHLDAARKYCREGATGFGVGLLYQLVKGLKV